MGLLEGRRVLLTGAGRGIGRETALAMAREGALLVMNDLDEAPLAAVRDEILALGGRAAIRPGDVTAESFADAFVETVLEEFGGLEVIVNNAGCAWDAMLHKMTDEQWCSMLSIHVTAPFRIIRAATPYLRDTAKRESAAGIRVIRKIVNVSSTSGTAGSVGQANYAAAKAGVIGLTKTLARELGPLNVCCNVVAFGWIATRMIDDREAGQPRELHASYGVSPEVRQKVLDTVPFRRAGAPSEAASGILFLASPMSDYVNGHVLHVDGGLDM